MQNSKLTAELQVAISQRPTKTFLRKDDDTLDVQLIESTKIHKFDLPDLPDQFDGKRVWKDLLTPVMNQGSCGSCWAFATVGSLGDRFNIQSGGKMHVVLSPTKLILCDWRGSELIIDHPEDSVSQQLELNRKSETDASCFGNSLFDAFRYLYTIGTTTLACIPYNKQLTVRDRFQQLRSFRSSANLPLCNNVSGPLGDMCSDFYIDEVTSSEGGTGARFFKAYHFNGIAGTEKYGGSERVIRKDIYKFGPVATAMSVYPDFYTFDHTQGIYQWNGKGPQVGGHAIVIVGWGVEKGVLYWQIRNSWGKKWGMEGYFRMVRGINNCGIEENAMGAIPDFFYPRNYEWTGEGKHGETEKVIEERNKIAYDKTMPGGGIDPETGYTRRVMLTQPWLDRSKPALSELPNYKTFVAGRDVRFVTSSSTSVSGSSPPPPGSATGGNIWIPILSLLLLLLLIGLCGFLWTKKKK